eukprot:s156_g39.t1
MDPGMHLRAAMIGAHQRRRSRPAGKQRRERQRQRRREQKEGAVGAGADQQVTSNWPALLELVQAPEVDVHGKAPSPRRKRLRAFALGHVEPEGWLKEVLRRSAEGLAGHLFEFYPPVVDSNFLGGQSSYSSLFEDFPYALNGLVPLAAGASSTRLAQRCHEAVQRVLQSAPGGWLGPDEWPDDAPAGQEEERAGLLSASLWSRWPLLQGLVQYAEWQAPSRLACDALGAVEEFLTKLQQRLERGRARLIAWSAARWCELVLTLNFLERSTATRSTLANGQLPYAKSLLANAGVAGARARLRLAELVQWQLSNRHRWPFQLQPLLPRRQQRRGGEVGCSLERRLRSTCGGGPGGLVAICREKWGEHLAGSDAFRGTELCVVVESMRSLEESYAALPDRPELIDALERLAFNALPAAVSEDQWTHQRHGFSVDGI